jgi:hypothetical protein
MEFAGLSDERRTQHSVARHKSNRSSLVSDRRARGPLGHGVRDAAGDTETPEAADHRQAAYFLQVLAQNRRLSDERIDKFQRALAISQADGDVEGACGFRRLLRSEEHDRQQLDHMIENLRRRFPREAPLSVR